MKRFLIDDQGRTKKQLKPLDVCPTLRREMHGNEPRVVEPLGWEQAENKNEYKGEMRMSNFEGKPFNYVSLFSGIGGFETALNALGGNCVMASEIDKFANQAYEVLYGHPTVGDVTKVEAEDVPDHELLAAGFPCQAFSVAGRRGGFSDTRGTLFFEVARIAKVKKPRMLLLENVKGLVGHDKGKTLDTIIKTLNDIGYTVDFEVLNSKYFGVPQNRERIFIAAVRDDLVEAEEWRIEGNNVVAKGKKRLKSQGAKTFNFDWPTNDAVTCRLRDILESDVDERYYLSEEKTSKLVEQLRDREREYLESRESDDVNAINTPEIIKKNQNGRRIKENDDPMHALTVQDRHGVVEPQMIGHVELKGHDAIKRVYSAEGVSPTLTTMGGGHREPKIAEEQQGVLMNRHAIGRETEISHCLMARDYKGFGNQEMTGVIEAEEVRATLTPDREEKRQQGRRFKENDEPAFTLNTQDKHGVAIGKIPKYRIRKLTPLECWRLQGFSDEQHSAVEEAGISNSQRYKMAGNAVTVNVISAIGKRLLPYVADEGGEA